MVALCPEWSSAWPVLKPRAGQPPHGRTHNQAKDKGHGNRPPHDTPLFAVIVLTALARQQVEALAGFMFPGKKHLSDDTKSGRKRQAGRLRRALFGLIRCRPHLKFELFGVKKIAVFQEQRVKGLAVKLDGFYVIVLRAQIMSNDCKGVFFGEVQV